MVSPAIGVEACSAAHVTQLSRVTFVIMQILKQVEPATCNMSHSGKKVTQSWQLQSGLREMTGGIQMLLCGFCSKGCLNGFLLEERAIPASSMWPVWCSWTFRSVVSLHEASCPELAAAEAGLPAPATAAPITHSRTRLGRHEVHTKHRACTEVSSETNRERSLLENTSVSQLLLHSLIWLFC